MSSGFINSPATHDNLSINSQALMDSNLPRLQLELYKEIKKVVSVCGL